MNAVTSRSIFRWIHILISAPIIFYIYAPFAQTTMVALLVKFVFIPVVALSGLWMWKGAALKRYFTK
jgi:hypothetical protein